MTKHYGRDNKHLPHKRVVGLNINREQTAIDRPDKEEDKMKTMYISGKITGRKREEYTRHFAKIGKRYQGMYKTYNPVPAGEKLIAKLGYLPDRNTFIRFFEKEILWTCDLMYMLKGWRYSPGARYERSIAKKRGIPILYEVDDQDERGW